MRQGLRGCVVIRTPDQRLRVFVSSTVGERGELAEERRAVDSTPDDMQHLLAGAVWDADAVRDDVRGYVTELSASLVRRQPR